MEKYSNFPEKLRQEKKWVLWKTEVRDGKPTKVPYSPHSRRKADSTDPETWGTFEESVKALEKGKYDGIGFVFDYGTVGIDLDHCIEPDGSVKKWAQEILDRFDSYVEYSPSGKGLHLIIEAEIDFAGKGRKKWIDKAKQEAVECYTRGRYFTVTGNVYEKRRNLNHIHEPSVFEWHKAFFDTGETLVVSISPPTTIMPEDQGIVTFMRNARNGQRFRLLYDQGDWRTAGFPSQSEADMSLVSSLMFFARNDEQIADRIFRSSMLMRKKWERADYRADLFRKCVHSQVMDWSRPDECDEPEDELELVDLHTVIPENINWIWKGWLAEGKLALWSGDPDKGKSQMTIMIASIISRGGVFPDGYQASMGTTLFMTAEDSVSDTLVPRLMAVDADLTKTKEVRWIITKDRKKQLFTLEKNLSNLKKTVMRMNDLKLIVIDPISAFMGKIDSNSNAEVRGLLAGLQEILEERSCALIMISHSNKSSGQKALSRVSGSIAFGAASRMGAIFGTRPLDDGEEEKAQREFIMAPLKNNLSKEPPSLLYRIVEETVYHSDKPIYTSKIDWLGESDWTSQQIADYIPKGKKSVGRPAEKFSECVSILRELIANRSVINPQELLKIREELRFRGDFKEQMVKKAQKSLGYRTILERGQDVSWVKEDEISADDVPL